MNPDDFVYNQIFKGALNKKATNNNALKQAVIGMEKYKKGKIAKKVSHLIEEGIAAAVKDSKRGR